MSAFIGIDIGGTKIAGGIVSIPDGALRERRIIPSNAARGGEAVLRDVENLIEKLAAIQKVDGVGLGICELVNRRGEIASDNCVQWQGLDVWKKLARFGRIVIEADVRAAALAEAKFGAGKEFESFLYVTIGTGISCCLIVNGKPWLGANGLTGTMASSPLFGMRESVEDLASGPGLLARYSKLQPDKATQTRDTLALAARGDASAIKVVKRGSEALGTTLGLLVNTLDPAAIVVGGGLGMATGLYWENLCAETRQHIWSPAQREIPILKAATGENAGIIGAAVAASNAAA